MLALSADSRQAVDRITDAAGGNGGKADVNPKQDHGFMYGRSFEDVDGHIWESVFVDMSQFRRAAERPSAAGRPLLGVETPL